MAKVKIQGNAAGSGVFTVTAPVSNTNRTITLPDSAGTLLDENSSVPAANLTGNLPAISGASLTNLPAQTLAGLTDSTISSSDPATNSNPSAVGHLWLNSTSGNVYVCSDATSNSNVWFNVGKGGDPDVEYLVVAGGGGGGGNSGGSAGGGGGAGGYRTATISGMAKNIGYTLTIGAGGARETNGSDSTFGPITSTGGGAGANSSSAGFAGGSGGGGSRNSCTAGGAAVSGQGYAGGAGCSNGGDGMAGGGGAGGVGNGGASAVLGGPGGVGLASTITGSSVYRAGGGGGGGYDTSNGGAGGNGGGGRGANGVSETGTAGTANTGGGGGGGADQSGHSGTHGGAGGSGIIILKISDDYTATFSSGVTSSTNTSVSGFKIYSITAANSSQTVSFT
tara:strand:- start:471 stop:1652 length:1182 start_codon:yes stop_codon:yes gene_type:complete